MSTVDNVPTRDELRKEVRDFVLPLAGMTDLADDQPLISEHVLDSLSAVQMIDFVERRFGITVEDADLDLRNFDTMSGLISLILGKLSGGAP